MEHVLTMANLKLKPSLNCKFVSFFFLFFFLVLQIAIQIYEKQNTFFLGGGCYHRNPSLFSCKTPLFTQDPSFSFLFFPQFLPHRMPFIRGIENLNLTPVPASVLYGSVPAGRQFYLLPRPSPSPKLGLLDYEIYFL